MQQFRTALAERQTDPDGRTWVYVPYDQLTHQVGPLSRLAPEQAGIVCVENPWKAGRRPYHKQKLALILANQRQFALEQAGRGVAVRYEIAKGPYRDTLGPLAKELGGLSCMRPAERELRADLEPLIDTGALTIEAHEGWLTGPEDLQRSHPKGPPYRMDRFYAQVRKRTGVLMEADGKPVGGKYSFDAENRQSWNGDPALPKLPRFRPDAITEEVLELIETRFARHPGRLDGTTLPTTREHANRVWAWARKECMEHFGPYQDAMTERSNNLFHTRVSTLMHIGRLLPARVVADVEQMDLPLSSKEGFIRQVLGWREFVARVHEATDGFRALGKRSPEVDERPGDAGWNRWAGESWAPKSARRRSDGVDGGARISALAATEPVPPALWGEESGLRCLDKAVADVWDEGYGHHITRLMVIANLGTLLSISPRELTDWFWCAYTDAFDWVVEPNVLGMGTYGVGELMTTKPYVSGAAYIDRMGDHCGTCAFHPKKTCPITRLYWSFLSRNEERLRGNVRVAMPLRSLAKRSGEQRELDERVYEHVRRTLADGERLDPEEMPT
ncbi:MAG: cryptochrome/photolyase family protein [Planctomycetota bacterium]|jgi:deoxyribodipyrimidine photolyase-related protein